MNAVSRKPTHTVTELTSARQHQNHGKPSWSARCRRVISKSKHSLLLAAHSFCSRYVQVRARRACVRVDVRQPGRCGVGGCVWGSLLSVFFYHHPSGITAHDLTQEPCINYAEFTFSSKGSEPGERTPSSPWWRCDGVSQWKEGPAPVRARAHSSARASDARWRAACATRAACGACGAARVPSPGPRALQVMVTCVSISNNMRET